MCVCKAEEMLQVNKLCRISKGYTEQLRPTEEGKNPSKCQGCLLLPSKFLCSSSYSMKCIIRLVFSPPQSITLHLLCNPKWRMAAWRNAYTMTACKCCFGSNLSFQNSNEMKGQRQILATVILSESQHHQNVTGMWSNVRGLFLFSLPSTVFFPRLSGFCKEETARTLKF